MPTELRLAHTLIFYVRARAREARAAGRNHIGASAIEWAIISAVVVGLALGIYAVIKRVVDSRTAEIEQGI